MEQDSPVGRIARVTGRVGPGRVGEVMVSIRGGSEAFHAYPFTPGDAFETGTQVLVVDYQPPRNVYVSSL